MADMYGGSPQDVKLPNRRTARGGPGTPSRTADLVDVRNQLAALQQDAMRDAIAGGGTKADLEDEVTSLYHELQRAAGKLEMEKAQRKKAEAELESVRQHRLRETSDVVQELEKKRGELNALREERAMMKEWLDRGVLECKRVAEEVVHLKSELESSDRSNAQLNKDRHRLAATIQQLSDELASVQLALEKAHHEKAMLELKSEEASTSMEQSEHQRKAMMTECDRLAAEVTRLSQRVRGLEDAEIAMQSMIACLTELIREVGDTEVCVTTNNLDAPPISEGIAAAAAAGIVEPRPLASMLVDSKRRLHDLQDSVSRLRASVKRFVAGRQREHQELAAQHRAAMQTLQIEKDSAAAAHRAQVEALQQRIVDLEREIILVADGVSRDTHQEAQQRMQQLDAFAQAHRDLTQQLAEVKAENDQLRAKSKKMKLDWSKVDDSRRRFQQLQAEVTLMREYNDKLVMENRNLRMMVEGNRGTAPTYANSPGSSVRSDRQSMVNRQAFDDWRSTKLAHEVPPAAAAAAGSPYTAAALSASPRVAMSPMGSMGTGVGGLSPRFA